MSFCFWSNCSLLPPASIIPCLVSLLPLSPPLFPNNLFSAQGSKSLFENQLKSHPLFSLSIDVPSHPKQRSKSIQWPTRHPMVWFSRYHSNLTAHSLLFLIPFMVPTQSFAPVAPSALSIHSQISTWLLPPSPSGPILSWRPSLTFPHGAVTLLPTLAARP